MYEKIMTAAGHATQRHDSLYRIFIKPPSFFAYYYAIFIVPSAILLESEVTDNDDQVPE
jgi:hypothetical protein